ncbi:uncharacterized protein LOC144110823 [Amblyomma americanum]
MPYKRRYGRYLYDPKCEVPLRSKYRFKKAENSASGCINDRTVKEDWKEDDATGESFCGGSGSSDRDKASALPAPSAMASDEPTAEGCMALTMDQSEDQMEDETEEQIGNETAATVEPCNDFASESGTSDSSFCSQVQRSENTDDPKCRLTDMVSENSFHSLRCMSADTILTSNTYFCMCYDWIRAMEDSSEDCVIILGYQPLYPGAQLTKAESILLVMGHSLRHCASKEATESVLKLVEAHLPKGTDFPSTKHTQFFKNFSLSDQKRKHFYCSACNSYIGELENSALNVSCPYCKKEHCTMTSNAQRCYFYTVDFENQIRDILEEKASCFKMCAHAYDVSDITQSRAYHRLPLQPGDLTLTFNTDGVPLYESSGFGMWPLLLQVNELEYNERMQRLLLAGLWFRSKKPAMNTFLLPFVQHMNSLSSEGITWRDSTGKDRITKVFPGPCSVDSVARCEVMCMTQFNGEHGCVWCEEPGEVVNKGRGHCCVYPTRSSAPALRTQESFLKHANKEP